MTREDLLQSLGTIARSGTAKFAEVGPVHILHSGLTPPAIVPEGLPCKLSRRHLL